jgi:hypothetical protein
VGVILGREDYPNGTGKNFILALIWATMAGSPALFPFEITANKVCRLQVFFTLKVPLTRCNEEKTFQSMKKLGDEIN